MPGLPASGGLTVRWAARNALAGGPSDGLGVPRLTRNVGEIHQLIYSVTALLIEQDLGKLGAGEGIFGPNQPSLYPFTRSRSWTNRTAS